MLKRFFARLPLTDRITFSLETDSALLYGVFTGLALPLIPIAARKMGMAPAGIAVMLGMQFVGALTGLFFGHLADRLPRMPLAVWPMVVSRAAVGALAVARTPGPFLAFASLYYLAANINGPAYASIMRSNYSEPNRGRLMSIIRMEVVTVSAVCSTIASLFLGASGAFRWLFLAASVFGLLSAAGFARIKVRRVPAVMANAAPVSFRASLAVVRRNVPFMVFMAIYFICTTPDKLTFSLEPIRFVDELGISYRDTALILGTVVSLSSIAGYYLWGRALKRMNSFTLLTALVFLLALRFASIALARNTALLIPTGILGGLNNAGWDLIPLFCILALADSANFSLYFGFHTTLLGLRGIAGPFLGTYLYTSGALSLTAIFWLVAGITALGGALLIPFARRAARIAAAARPALGSVSRSP